VVGDAVALQPLFCGLAVPFIPGGDQMNEAALFSQGAQGVCRVISRRYVGEDGLDTGVKELLYLFPGFVESIFYIIGWLGHGLAEILAGSLQPDVLRAIVIVGQYSVDIKAKN
jgi:hypothetical protein